MSERPKRNLFFWFLAALCFALGILIYFGIPSYSFSGLICLGLGAVILCFLLLERLEHRAITAAKVLRTILSTCLFLGLLTAAVTGIIIFKGSLGDPATECEYVIVLGCGVNGTVPSLSLRERINAAYDYLTVHPNAVCVVSGGQGRNEDISEAECMYRELTDMGIAPGRIWMEDQSTSTTENLQFSLSVIAEKTGTQPEHIGIVSSEYHLYRAGLMAEDLGVTVSGIPAATSWLSLRTNYFLREIAAVWYYLIGRIFV